MSDPETKDLTVAERFAAFVNSYDKHLKGNRRFMSKSLYDGMKTEVVTLKEAQAALLDAQAEAERLRGALEEIYALADTFEPVMSHLCPPGCLPTPWMERQATVLAQPFIIARLALSPTQREGN